MKRNILILTAVIAGAISCNKSNNGSPTPPPNGKDTTKTPPVDTNAGKTGTVTFIYRHQQVTYTTVVAKDGRTWLQQSLGSSRVATSADDSLAYGHYFQWGRWDDGHQLPNSPYAVDAAYNFAALNGGDSIYRQDWMKNTGAATDKWEAATVADVTATNGCDPCKAISPDWHVPTRDEWDTLRVREGITNLAQAFASNLKLTNSAGRSGTTGLMYYDNIGIYWSNTAAGFQNGAASGWGISFYPTEVTLLPYGMYSNGYPVRCILQK